MSDWSLYLIRTAAGSLYTGITTDVERRFAEHDAGGARAAKALRGRGPLSLAFQCGAADKSAALRLEARIKKWPRRWKEELIRGDRPLPELEPGDVTAAETETGA
ncbi:GIY-YIG nuclease family protein [Microbulbifer sediminum]|uniref:GIY-YIG nuclease family protein n=1 Tax=Microbulbifer sediminum TaxID=2904250 RepID=UPI001F1AE259|nr:GIY-YIG nuclease family protein [Microbulbifer sediminum]